MTLVEALVATVILGIGVSGLLAGVTLGVRNQERSAQRAQALGVAQEQLAQVDLIGPHVWMLGRPTQGETQVGDRTYTWSLSITQQPVGELFSVTASVSWDNGSVQLATMLNDYAAKSSMTPQQLKDRAAPSEANRNAGEM